jgi:hypothetical protein
MSKTKSLGPARDSFGLAEEKAWSAFTCSHFDVAEVGGFSAIEAVTFEPLAPRNLIIAKSMEAAYGFHWD